MSFVSCNKLATELAKKQDNLKDCNGDPLVAGTPMVTCEHLEARLDDVGNMADGTNTTVSGTGTAADPHKVNVAAATDSTPGVIAVAVADNFPSTSDSEAATPAYVKRAVDTAVADVGNLADGTNTTVSGAGTAASPHKVNVADAADTVKGVVALAVAANHPSTSDTEAATPAYVAAAITAGATPDATDTVKGKVSLAVAANHPSTSDTEAATPAYVAAALGALTLGTTELADGTTILGAGTSTDKFRVANPVPANSTPGKTLTPKADGTFEWVTPPAGGTTEVADGTTILGAGTSTDKFRVARPVPSGGTDGQILTVQADGTAAWEDAPAGGGGTTELADGTTILGAGTSTDKFRVAVPLPSGGTSGQVPTKQADGTISWATPSSGGGGGGGLTAVAVSAPLTGDGTSGSPIGFTGGTTGQVLTKNADGSYGFSTPASGGGAGSEFVVDSANGSTGSFFGKPNTTYRISMNSTMAPVENITTNAVGIATVASVGNVAFPARRFFMDASNNFVGSFPVFSLSNTGGGGA